MKLIHIMSRLICIRWDIMRKNILLICIIVLLSGCSSSTTNSNNYQQKIEDEKNRLIISQAESCDNGTISSYFRYEYGHDMCEIYTKQRDELVAKEEREKQQQQERFMELLPYIILMIVMIVVSVIFSIYRSKKEKEKQLEYIEKPYLDPTKSPLDILSEIDKKFSETFLVEGLEKLLLSVYEMIVSGNHETIEPYIGSALLAQFVKEHETILQNKMNYRFSELHIRNFSIYKYEYVEGDEVISIDLTYEVNRKEKFENGEELISVIPVTTTIKLRRPYKTQTPIGKVDFITNCKQCGGPVNPKHDRVCIYCGAGLPSHAFTWILIQCNLQRSL